MTDETLGGSPEGGTLPKTLEERGYIFVNEGRCHGCGAVIEWWMTVAGKRSPHDPDGVSHFATCPERARFRRRR